MENSVLLGPLCVLRQIAHTQTQTKEVLVLMQQHSIVFRAAEPINVVEDRAHQSGAARLALDVSISNDGAHKLYERRGMRVESESPKLFFSPQTRFFRMVKTL